MKNNLLITLPIILIFSLIVGSFSYTLLRANDYSTMSENSILFTSSHQEKQLKDLYKSSTIKDTRELASKLISKNIKESNSIYDLLQSRVKHSADDLMLLTWVFISLFVLTTIFAIGVYPIIKRNHGKS